MNLEKHTRTVKHRFSAAAKTYNDQAVVQKLAAVQLIQLIPKKIKPDSILEVGCGSGQLTQLLRKLWPRTSIHAIDISEKMVHEAKKMFTKDHHISFETADASTFHSEQKFSLLTSNCALHWLYPFHWGMKNLTSMISDRGHLAIALMLHGTLKELHEARLHAAPHKPPLARLPEHEHVIKTLQSNGFTLDHVHVETKETSAPSAREALTVLHEQGLTGGAISRAKAPLTRSELEKLIAHYQKHHEHANGVRMSYRVGYYVAHKS